MCTFATFTSDEHAVILGQVDLRTLLVLRSCSRHTLKVVAYVLGASLRSLCDAFLEDTGAFLQHLTASRAVIGGQVAVRFMLRDLTFVPDSLEVFVPAAAHKALQQHFVEVEHATVIVGYDSPENDNESWLLSHTLHYTDVLLTPEGRTIKLHRVGEMDALAGIACTSTSAEVMYVTPEHFGTAYPALLFRHRALLADWKADADTAGWLQWMKRGIDLRVAARAWEEYRGMYCAAKKWVCHTQRRRFTDGGALRAGFQPLQDPPLDSVVVWRLDLRPCGGHCIHVEDEDDWELLYKYKMI